MTVVSASPAIVRGIKSHHTEKGTVEFGFSAVLVSHETFCKKKRKEIKLLKMKISHVNFTLLINGKFSDS